MEISIELEHLEMKTTPLMVTTVSRRILAHQHASLMLPSTSLVILMSFSTSTAENVVLSATAWWHVAYCEHTINLELKIWTTNEKDTEFDVVTRQQLQWVECILTRLIYGSASF